MKKIKIGDHVRGTAGSANMFTGPQAAPICLRDQT